MNMLIRILARCSIVILLGHIFLLGCSTIETEPLPALNFLGKKWDMVHMTLHIARQIDINSRLLIDSIDVLKIDEIWKAPSLEFRLPSSEKSLYTTIEVCRYTIPRCGTTYTRCWLLLVRPDGMIIAQRPEIYGDVSPPKAPSAVFTSSLTSLSERDLIEIHKFGYGNKKIIYIQDAGWVLPNWPIDISPTYDNTALNIIQDAWRRTMTHGFLGTLPKSQ